MRRKRSNRSTPLKEEPINVPDNLVLVHIYTYLYIYIYMYMYT